MYFPVLAIFHTTLALIDLGKTQQGGMKEGATAWLIQKETEFKSERRWLRRTRLELRPLMLVSDVDSLISVVDRPNGGGHGVMELGMAAGQKAWGISVHIN
jgi:hypothetical protein